MKSRPAVAIATLLACALGSLLPAQADPDAVAEAGERLAAIQQESSRIDQEIIEASLRAAESSQKLERINEDLVAQSSKVARLADELGAVAVLRLQSGGFDVTTQLLASASDDGFLSALATIQNETDRSNAAIQELQVEQATAEALRREAEATDAALRADLKAKQDLAGQFDAKEAEAQAVYDRLNAEEKERLRQIELERQRRLDEADRLAREAAARDGATTGGQQAVDEEAPADDESASDRAAKAVAVAKAQVGKRYVWGTSGPNTFDCSGLTSYAYRQAGIRITTSSRGQASLGRHVAKSDLRPGDLVFYYSPISHVGIYIGGGKIVDAANPRKGVRITSLNSMPYTTARRVA